MALHSKSRRAIATSTGQAEDHSAELNVPENCLPTTGSHDLSHKEEKERQSSEGSSSILSDTTEKLSGRTSLIPLDVSGSDKHIIGANATWRQASSPDTDPDGVSLENLALVSGEAWRAGGTPFAPANDVTSMPTGERILVAHSDNCVDIDNGERTFQELTSRDAEATQSRPESGVTATTTTPYQRSRSIDSMASSAPSSSEDYMSSASGSHDLFESTRSVSRLSRSQKARGKEGSHSSSPESQRHIVQGQGQGANKSRNSLLRSDSDASTVPTSPEQETDGSAIPEFAYDAKEPRKELNRKHFNDGWQMILDEKARSTEQLVHASQMVHQNRPQERAIYRSKTQRSLSVATTLRDADSTLSHTVTSASLAHRNKPLPTPCEDMESISIHPTLRAGGLCTDTACETSLKSNEKMTNASRRKSTFGFARMLGKSSSQFQLAQHVVPKDTGRVERIEHYNAADRGPNGEGRTMDTVSPRAQTPTKTKSRLSPKNWTEHFKTHENLPALGSFGKRMRQSTGPSSNSARKSQASAMSPRRSTIDLQRVARKEHERDTMFSTKRVCDSLDLDSSLECSSYTIDGDGSQVTRTGCLKAACYLSEQSARPESAMSTIQKQGRICDEPETRSHMWTKSENAITRLASTLRRQSWLQSPRLESTDESVDSVRAQKSSKDSSATSTCDSTDAHLESIPSLLPSEDTTFTEASSSLTVNIIESPRPVCAMSQETKAAREASDGDTTFDLCGLGDAVLAASLSGSNDTMWEQAMATGYKRSFQQAEPPAVAIHGNGSKTGRPRLHRTVSTLTPFRKSEDHPANSLSGDEKSSNASSLHTPRNTCDETSKEWSSSRASRYSLEVNAAGSYDDVPQRSPEDPKSRHCAAAQGLPFVSQTQTLALRQFDSPLSSPKADTRVQTPELISGAECGEERGRQNLPLNTLRKKDVMEQEQSTLQMRSGKRSPSAILPTTSVSRGSDQIAPNRQCSDQPAILPRPTSASGFRPEMMPMLEPSAPVGSGLNPSLAITDDREFLHALETVRSRKIERALQKQNSLDQGRVGNGDDSTWQRDQHQIHADKSHARRRVNSAASSLRLPDVPGNVTRATERPVFPLLGSLQSPLERGLGKASGKIRDSSLMSDEDWKEEVKALFIIREIVLTERSYAAHLEALLNAVESVHRIQRLSGRSSSGGLLSANTRPSSHSSPHITILMRLLPRMIAMSQTLANLIDKDPTAAGVGSAFCCVSVDLKALFVEWSSVANSIHEMLRYSEGPKGKSRDRLGLISLATTIPPAQEGGVCNSTMTCRSPSPSTPTRSQKEGDDWQAHLEVDASLFARSAAMFERHTGQYKDSFSFSSKRRTTPLSQPTRCVSSGSGEEPVSLLGERGSYTMGRKSMSAARIQSTTSQWPSNEGCQTTCTSACGRRSDCDASDSPLRASPPGSLMPCRNKAMSAMDIAIMPTQRIPRYLLLLRDLYGYTPASSLSQARLHRTIVFMEDVAANCNGVSTNVRRPNAGSSATNGAPKYKHTRSASSSHTMPPSASNSSASRAIARARSFASSSSTMQKTTSSAPSSHAPPPVPAHVADAEVRGAARSRA